MRNCGLILAWASACGCDCGYESTSADGGTDGDADVDVDSDADADPECLDADGDGAAPQPGCSPWDCDDTDPATIDECGTGCDAQPERTGCPCEGNQPAACYTGPEGTGGTGRCEPGLRRCIDGAWGGCDGQVLPVPEDCDEVDDDCDGQVDDGVQNECGNCSLDCSSECIGAGCEQGFEPDDPQIQENPDGSITLSDSMTPQHSFIWVSNSGEGTVSKIDTVTRTELGRYRTADGYPDPSRTTVNLRGDVVVANRGDGSATRIQGSDCVDQDGDGLRTSGGGDEILDWADDDCVVWKVDGIPSARGSAFEVRAELDGSLAEYVWVASYPFYNGPVYEIDAEAGEMTGRQVDNAPGYGAALGPDHQLWLAAAGGCITQIDTVTLDRTDHQCPQGEYAYGIAVDAEGRVWIGGSVARYDPATDEWDSPAQNMSAGGIAVDVDGNAWVGEPNYAYRIDGETMEATPIPGAGGHGWAIDFDGYAWAIEMGDSATVVDPDTLEVERVTPPFVFAYTYSDMTGYQLQNVTPHAGTIRHVFEGCEDGLYVEWTELVWTGEVPEGTSVRFLARTAWSLEELSVTPWVVLATVPGDTSPASIRDALDDAGVDHGSLLELEITLTKDLGAERPRLDSVAVERSCWQE